MTDPFAPSAAVAAPRSTEAEFRGGTSSEVLAWVGASQERAQLALEIEIDSGSPRKSLVYQLERIV